MVPGSGDEFGFSRESEPEEFLPDGTEPEELSFVQPEPEELSFVENEVSIPRSASRPVSPRKQGGQRSPFGSKMRQSFRRASSRLRRLPRWRNRKRLRRAAIALGVLLMLAGAAVALRVCFLDRATLRGQLMHSTVWVVSPRGTGTGSLLDVEQRLIITNDHVAQGNSVGVHFPVRGADGKWITRRDYYDPSHAVPGTVVFRAREKDLAIIELRRLPDNARAIALADASPQPGDSLHTLGNPGAGIALWTYRRGDVQNVVVDHEFEVAGTRLRATVVEMDLNTNFGDSGGPVANEKGELVAVNQSIQQGARFSYGIDVTEVKEVLRRFHGP